MEFEDKNFKLEDFHEVNKIRIAIDLLGAMQAQYRRFTIGANHPLGLRSGTVDINTANGGVGEFGNSSDASSSGNMTMRTGHALGSLAGDSGGLLIRTGNSAVGEVGNIRIEAGTASGQGKHGGAVDVVAGTSTS